MLKDTGQQTKKTPPKGKGVCYTYLKDTNLRFLKTLSTKNGRTLSYCLDEIISAIRLKKDFKITPEIPKYVQKAEEYKKRKKAALKR